MANSLGAKGVVLQKTLIRTCKYAVLLRFSCITLSNYVVARYWSSISCPYCRWMYVLMVRLGQIPLKNVNINLESWIHSHWNYSIEGFRSFNLLMANEKSLSDSGPTFAIYMYAERSPRHSWGERRREGPAKNNSLHTSSRHAIAILQQTRHALSWTLLRTVVTGVWTVKSKSFPILRIRLQIVWSVILNHSPSIQLLNIDAEEYDCPCLMHIVHRQYAGGIFWVGWFYCENWMPSLKQHSYSWEVGNVNEGASC